MRALRILYCTDTYPPQVNGVSVVTALSVDGMLSRGWECGVVCPAYPATWSDPFTNRGEYEAATQRTTLPSAPLPIYPDIRLSLPIASRFSEAIRTLRPDIVHAETEFIIGRLGARAARRASIPVVTSYHTDFGKYVEAYGLPSLRGPVTRSLAKFHSSASRTYTPSAHAALVLNEMGVNRVEVWGRGVDVDIFSPTHRRAALREELGLGDAFTFLHVGRLAEEKGVEHILSAFALLRDRVAPRPVRLVIAGAGPRRDWLRALATPDTVFLPHLDRTTRLPALYASCDAFVFASVTETLGLVILEAMASGLPVIAAPAGGVKDSLRHHENGLAYAPGDARAFSWAMQRIAEDSTLRDRLAVGARRTAEARSWTHELDRLDDSYREIIDQAKQRLSA
ncbi:MAG: glycosyltransferase family 1 protein [bacterium]